jgi:hypothetical protein
VSSGDSLDGFVAQLCELELDADSLRADPHGERWLPASLRRRVHDDPACARELAEFVAMELALADTHEPSDAFFTRAVMDRLPELDAVDDRRRTWILASAYALAIGVGYLLLGPLLSSGELLGAVEPLHRWAHDHALEASGVWITLALLAISGVLVLAPTQRRRTA